MKRFLLSFLLLLAFAFPVFATDITISQSNIPNANFNTLPPEVTGTASVTNGSASVTFSTATIPSQYVGVGGWQISLAGTIYNVLSTESRTALTLSDNYTGTTSTSAAAIIYPAIALQIYASAPFTPNGATYVVQSGSVGSAGGFFFRTACTVRRVSGVQTLFIPAVVLPSPIDSPDNIGRSVRFSAWFFQLSGAQIRVYDGFDSFQLPASPTTNTWPVIRTYNVPLTGRAIDNSTLSRDQILALTSNVTSGNVDLGDASRVAVSDSSGRLDASSVASSDLSYLAAAAVSSRGTSRKGERARYAIASLPTCNSGSVDVTVNVSDGNKGQRTCREVSSGVYGWVDDDPVFRPERFGLSPSASATVNATALNAMIDAMPVTGGTIVLPSGTFNFNATWNLYKTGTAWKLIVRGSGATATVLNWTGATNAVAIKARRIKRFSFEGIGLTNGAGSKGTSVGFWLTSETLAGSDTGPGTFTNFSISGFHKGYLVGDTAGGNSASEIAYHNFSLEGNDTNEIQGSNSLNHQFYGLNLASNGIGLEAVDPDCIFIYGGSATLSSVQDFAFRPSGTFSVQNFRSEGAERFITFGPDGGGGASSPTIASLKNIRIAATNASDKRAIRLSKAGHYQIEGVNLQEGKIYINSGHTVKSSLTLRNNAIVNATDLEVDSQAYDWFVERLVNTNTSTGAGAYYTFKTSIYTSAGEQILQSFAADGTQVYFPSGGTATPGISWIGDENTGFYRASNGRVVFSSDGTPVADFSGGTVPITVLYGAASPSISNAHLTLTQNGSNVRLSEWVDQAGEQGYIQAWKAGTGYNYILNLQPNGGTVAIGDNVTIGSTGTSTATAGAATLNKQTGVITSESLTTAAGSAYTLTLTNSLIASTSRILVSYTDGTNTQGLLVQGKVTAGSGSATIIFNNIHASQALNGTIKIVFWVI